MSIIQPIMYRSRLKRHDLKRLQSNKYDSLRVKYHSKMKPPQRQEYKKTIDYPWQNKPIWTRAANQVITFLAAVAPPALDLPFVVVVRAGAVDGRSSSSTSTVLTTAEAGRATAAGFATEAGAAFWGRFSRVFSSRGSTWSFDDAYKQEQHVSPLLFEPKKICVIFV